MFLKDLFSVTTWVHIKEFQERLINRSGWKTLLLVFKTLLQTEEQETERLLIKCSTFFFKESQIIKYSQSLLF